MAEATAASSGRSTNRLPWILTAAAAALVLLSFLFPLWILHLTAPQYPETLNLNVYAYKFAGSDNPVIDDIQEINTLNHYIGMAEIHERDFPELRILPVALVACAALLGLAAALRTGWLLVLGTALLAVTGVGGLGSAYFKLYTYGHNLDPSAPLKVPGFTPPLLGTNKLVNFMTTGMFGLGGYMLILSGVLLLTAIYLWRRQEA